MIGQRSSLFNRARQGSASQALGWHDRRVHPTPSGRRQPCPAPALPPCSAFVSLSISCVVGTSIAVCRYSRRLATSTLPVASNSTPSLAALFGPLLARPQTSSASLTSAPSRSSTSAVVRRIASLQYRCPASLPTKASCSSASLRRRRPTSRPETLPSRVSFVLASPSVHRCASASRIGVGAAFIKVGTCRTVRDVRQARMGQTAPSRSRLRVSTTGFAGRRPRTPQRMCDDSVRMMCSASLTAGYDVCLAVDHGRSRGWLSASADHLATRSQPDPHLWAPLHGRQFLKPSSAASGYGSPRRVNLLFPSA